MVLTNQPKQTKDTSENFDDEDLDEQVRVRSVSEGSGGAGNSNADATEQVARADGDATPEDGET